MSGRTLQVGQVWEHWRSKNRVKIDDFGGFEGLVQCTGDDGQPYSIDPEDLLSSYLYLGTLE